MSAVGSTSTLRDCLEIRRVQNINKCKAEAYENFLLDSPWTSSYSGTGLTF